MPTIIVHNPALTAEDRQLIETRLSVSLHKAHNCYKGTVLAIEPTVFQSVRESLSFDINLLGDGFKPEQIKLVISDMDSTLVSIECIDEIADFANLKSEVAAITESAMRGELDFAASLTRRVSLLAGLDVSVLEKVYLERLKLNPGAEDLLAGLEQKGISFALVSGGFTFFTDRLKNRLPISYAKANVLGKEQGKLDGTVDGVIVDGKVKREFLQQICTKMKIRPQQAIALGDGANDLAMMDLASLGVAYHAKPTVQAQTDVQINHGWLDLVLDFLSTTTD